MHARRSPATPLSPERDARTPTRKTIRAEGRGQLQGGTPADAGYCLSKSWRAVCVRPAMFARVARKLNVFDTQAAVAGRPMRSG